MKILFEGYKYITEVVKELLPVEYFDINSTQLKPRVVGYHYSHEFNCPIIILPKVFLDENDCFFLDGIKPETFLEVDYLSLIPNPDTKNLISKFFFECSTWFYFSIKKYLLKYRNKQSVFEEDLNLIDCSHKENFHTELDIIISLLKFNKENKDLFLFIKKINSSQKSKINWNRTIKKINPVVDQSGTPIYLQTLGKKKVINVDEDLLVLFFSVLKEIERKYNIKIPINPYYNLLSQKDYTKIKLRGTSYLRSIRYRYYDDRLLTLYRILYTFFEKSEASKINRKYKEYLIIKDYNLVFQDMIDELLSDTDIPKKLRTHKDGKELDHIYKSRSFLEEDGIYFIGDSKYYKRGNPIEEKSIYKQFTYAKNVIQFNIDVFNNTGGFPTGIRYRDELSEGYNITPNYFIRGLVSNLNYYEPELFLDSSQEYGNQINLHFDDRLFDRDTLVVQSYSINFLFALWSYVSSKGSDGNRFKVEAQRIFRKSLIKFIEENYVFSIVTPEISVTDFIKANFYNLNGRIYRPANFADTNSFIIALREGQDIVEYLKNSTVGNVEIATYRIN